VDRVKAHLIKSLVADMKDDNEAGSTPEGRKWQRRRYRRHDRHAEGDARAFQPRVQVM
jgi:hypothetical protein